MQKNKPTLNKQEAFMLLYKPAHESLYRFVQSLIWDKEETKDIVNETALIAFERFDTIKNKTYFTSYLFSIASNLCKKHYKIKKLKAMFDWAKADNNKAWQHAETNVNANELKNILQQLSFQQRRAFLLFELSGFSYQEISQIEKCSTSAIKSRIHTAKKILSQYLQNEEIQVQNIQLKTIIA